MSLIISKFGTMQSSNIWLPDNCIYEYALENNANDTFGVHNGTPYNMSYSAGKIGQSGVFNGSSSYIDLGSPAGFNRTAKTGVGCAYECWVYLDAWGTDDGNGSKRAVDDWNGWACYIMTDTSGTITGDKYAGVSNKVSKSGLSLSTWYHVVFNIYSNYTTELFVNTVSAGTNSNTSIPSNLTAGMFIGSGTSNNRYFDGLIDITRFYVGPLTRSQISTLYNAGVGRQYAAAI